MGLDEKIWGKWRSEHGGGILDKAIGKGATLTGEFMSSTLLGGELGRKISDGLKNAGLSDIFGEALTNAPLAGLKKNIIETFKNIGDVLSKGWEQADQSATAYGRRIGLNAEQVKNLRDETIRFSDETAKIGINYNKTIEDMIKLQSDYSSAVGRNIRLTNEQKESLAAMSVVVGDDMAIKLTSGFENFGISVSDAGDMLSEMFNDAQKSGLSLEEYSKNVVDNIGIAQRYTFRNGVEGLKAMAEKATNMKMDMQMVAGFADKMSDIEKSVEVSASLQVLGGSFSQFSDPLGMLYESMNDMEGLQDRMISMFGNLGTFNRERGEVEISAYNKQRIKAASEAAGLDYGKLIESINHSAKRNEIETQMNGLSNIDEKYKEVLVNTATFQNGRAGVSIDGQFKSLGQLTHKDLEDLKITANTDSQNIADIAKMLRGMTDVKQGTEKQKDIHAANKFDEQAENIKGIYQKVGESSDALEQLVRIETSYAMLHSFLTPTKNMATGILGDVTNVIKGLTKKHSEGGLITNGTYGKEYLLNSAQKGEFIVNASSTSKYLPILNAINKGTLRTKGNMMGGMVGDYDNSEYDISQIIGGMSYSSSMNPYMAMMVAKMKYGQLNASTPFIAENGYGKHWGENSINGNIGNTIASVYGSKIEKQLEGFRTDYQKGYIDMKAKTDLQIDGIKYKYNTDRKQWARMDSRNVPHYLQDRGVNKLTKAINSNNEKLMAEFNEKTNTTINKQQAFNANLNKWLGRGMAIGGGAIAGTISGFNQYAKYKADETAVMNKGKAMGGAIGNGVVTAVSTGLLSMIPVVGPMLGMTLGPIIGNTAGTAIGEAIGSGNQSRRGKYRKQIESELDGKSASAFRSIKGDYSVSELKEIKGALMNDSILEDYELSPDLAQKLRKNGNGRQFRKNYNGGLITNGQYGKEYILNSAQKGEYVINASSTEKYLPIIESINQGTFGLSEHSYGGPIIDNGIKPIAPMGRQMKVNSSSNGQVGNVGPSEITVKPIEIKLSGSIKLEGGGQNIDITKEIMKNPEIIRTITDMITKQININENGSFSKSAYKQTWSQI